MLPQFASPSRPGRVQRGLACLVLSALPAACAGTAGGVSGTTGSALRVTLRDYRSGVVLELVSESHTDPVDLYSVVRRDASRKVQSDVVMEALVDFLDDQGFEDRARPGAAPGGGAGLNSALEVDRGGSVTHMLSSPGQSLGDRQVYAECLRNFGLLYNETAAYQTVKNEQGAQFFDREKPTLGLQKPKGKPE